MKDEKETSPVLRSYTFKVVVEPDGDRWHAYCPALADHGAATWGNTKEEALKHIEEVVQMVVEELAEEGTTIPVIANEAVEVFPVSVKVSHAH